MKGLRRLTLYFTGWLILSILLLTAASAQESPVRINLVTDKTSYLTGEPVKMQVSVFNDSAEDVITHSDFSGQDFYLMVVFTDPDGELIRTKFSPGGTEPGPPARFEERDAVPAEVLLTDWNVTTVVDDVHYYYYLTKYGHYTAQVFVAIETFSEYVEDLDTGARFAFLDDTGRQFFNPVSSNKISFDIIPPEPVIQTSVNVAVEKLKIGAGTQPAASKAPLEGVPVHLIRSSSIPADYYPINYKTYPLIWDNVDPVRSGLTDSTGIAKFDSIDRDDYVIIGLYDRSQDFRHMGSQISASDPAWSSAQPIESRLMVLEKANGKKVPAKTTKRTGSLLLIHEPEYIVWDSTQELYPFIFESVGDWDVTVSVDPPEGFVSDKNLLSTDVSNEIESPQFTITDIGSRWEETGVTYKIKHKGKSEVIKSKIGVKLSERLAKEKGLGIYGHTKLPGPFKGGRKLSPAVTNTKKGEVSK